MLAVLYLLFTEGYAATSGGRLRGDLSAEAVRMTRILADLMPEEPDVLGLLALELCHDARRTARVDGAGRLVPLEEQDRTLWDRERIAEALGLVDRARHLAERVRRRGAPGPYCSGGWPRWTDLLIPQALGEKPADTAGFSPKTPERTTGAATFGASAPKHHGSVTTLDTAAACARP